MTDSGFVKAQSDNLPKIDAFMMTTYFASNLDFTSAELRGVKAARSEPESYGDSAVGYVQVKRENDLCIVKARITPEHYVRVKSYKVMATCNETEGTILSVHCEDCAAHLGGCKHTIAFLAWLHRRSEDPPSISIECYWKKTKLSSVGTSLKFIKAKDICNISKKNSEPRRPTQSVGGFFTAVKNYSQSVDNMDNQLMKYFKEPNQLEKLSIHYLRCSMQQKPTNAQEFIQYCKLNMNLSSCEEAALATVKQCDCPLWYELRYARITASKAYEAAHCKTFDGVLTESIMGATKLKDSEAMKRGRLLENKVLKRVEQLTNMKFKKSGLKLSPDLPIMGAAPDLENDKYIIEIKCPSSEKAISSYITKENKISSKCKAQIQLQMHFYNKTKALFCVASSEFEVTQIINIIEEEYDRDYCLDIIEKCTLFWCNAVYPLLFK